MGNYRIIYTDNERRIRGVPFMCPNDEQAIRYLDSHHEGRSCELREGERLVASRASVGSSEALPWKAKP